MNVRTTAAAAATMPPIPVRRVVVTSAPAQNRTTYAETARLGTRSAFDTMVTIATSTVSRTIVAQRAGETVSSSRKNCQARQRGVAGDSAVMMDDRDGRGPDPHQMLGRILQGDAHRKALGDHDPVEVALDGRHSGDGEVVQPGHRGADALDGPFEMLLGRSHHIGRDVVARADALQLRLPEVRDHEPLRGVDQREQRPDRAHDLADRRGYPDDPAVERSAHHRIPEVALREPDQRPRSLE